MKYFFVSWDCNGFEYIRDITSEHPDNWARKHLFETIKHNKVPSDNGLGEVPAVLLRARMNPHRNYEVYVFTSDDAIEEEDVRAWAEQDPQGAADWIRKNHSTKLFGSSSPNKKPVIV